MPISNFEGKTFAAFLDISGFKELMQEKDMAWKALDKLYSSGYDILRNQNGLNRVEGIFISDCGILFVRNNQGNGIHQINGLHSLLQVIKDINQRMLENEIMLTTSIAYGNFKYQERIEFPGIGKYPVYGDAYVSAYLDNKDEIPKIQPGQCRIVKENIPDEITTAIKQRQGNGIFSMIRGKRGDNKHYYYYWMVNNPNEIKRFEQNYKDAYNLKYEGMLKALKGIACRVRHGAPCN